MCEHKLACCVVRDLLPSYLEDLTEPETTALVRAHLDSCASCRQTAQAMRAQVPVERAPKRALGFLRRIRRTRLLAAVLTVLLTLFVMGWLYDQEYHYPNTEAGRLAAVEELVPSPADDTIQPTVAEGTPLRVLAYTEQDNLLYIAYAAQNTDRVHGILTLARGWNGKYSLLSLSMDPFPYSAGVMWLDLSNASDEGQTLYALMGDNCREIYQVRVAYQVEQAGSEALDTYEAVYPISEVNFLWLFDADTLKQELGIEDPQTARIVSADVSLLDQDGNDVTAQYEDQTVTDNWGAGKGTAERFLLYVYLGIVALLGVVFVRYFLHLD